MGDESSSGSDSETDLNELDEDSSRESLHEFETYDEFYEEVVADDSSREVQGDAWLKSALVRYGFYLAMGVILLLGVGLTLLAIIEAVSYLIEFAGESFSSSVSVVGVFL